VYKRQPHYFGIDGSMEISTSGVAYFLAKEINNKNVKLSQLAIVGALGDMQDRGERGTFIGLNSIIAKEAETAKILRTKLGLRLYGSESRPLIQCLANTMDPYLPGLTGDEGACLKFIKSLGIEPKKIDGSWKTQSDLSSEELRALISGLIKYLISTGLPSKEAEKIVGTIYIFPNEAEDSPLRDAREFSSSINACGRMGKYGLGISICLGDRNQALMELKQVIQEYRRTISRYINWILSNSESIKILSHVQAIHGGTTIDDKLLSPLLSILYTTKLFSRDKPIIGFSSSSGYVKVSARAPLELVNRGINLGLLIKDAAEKFGGIGGGHNIAAGAQIPLGKEEEFLMYLNEIIKREFDHFAPKVDNQEIHAIKRDGEIH
ncbi:MAG: DHH family phosphoesterase, partial [Candidatus Methanomethyliaceae archaeon]|nr:DHH family phosphoesterase [Candidatus Methanomethyliaceae archaeon]